MNAFQKAVALIQQQAALRGGFPASINIVRYRRRQFERLRPLEDYDDHLRQCEELKAWCGERGIEVVDTKIDGAPTAKERARQAARPPYNLGIIMSRSDKAHTGSIGFMAVYTGDPSNPDEGGEL